MKKYLNKALQFQWFYQTKAAIFAVVVLYAAIVFMSAVQTVGMLKNNLARLEGNIAWFYPGTILFAVVLVLVAIYFFSKGIDKRNKMYFITSGPFNKKQVLINEIFSLFSVLVLLVFICFYIGICIYIKEAELLTLGQYYIPNLLMLCLKVFLVGLFVIIFMELFDVFFSNTIAALIALVAMPVIIYLNLAYTYNFVGILTGYRYSIFNNIINKILGLLDWVIDFATNSFYPYYDISHEYFNSYDVNGFYGALVIIILAIILGGVVLFRLYDKVKLEEIGKIFTFRWIEKLCVYLVCYFSFIVTAIIIYQNNIGYSRFGGLVEVFVSLGFGAIVCLVCRRICSYILKFV